jgi:hypothetical protein
MTDRDAEPVRILTGFTDTGLTIDRPRRNLIQTENLLRKLRSFFATAISVNPPCKLMISNVKNRGVVITET